jgi:hypothetical protein
MVLDTDDSKLYLMGAANAWIDLQGGTTSTPEEGGDENEDVLVDTDTSKWMTISAGAYAGHDSTIKPPIDIVKVVDRGADNTTDGEECSPNADGKYYLTIGSYYRFSVEADGYISRTYDVKVSEANFNNGVLPVNPKMTPEYNYIEFALNITDSVDTSKTVDAELISVKDPNGEIKTPDEATGAYYLTVGLHTFTFRADGYKDKSYDFRIGESHLNAGSANISTKMTALS